MSQPQQITRAPKPKIRIFRDRGALWWACSTENKFGYGISPAIAYKNWARQMPRVEKTE